MYLPRGRATHWHIDTFLSDLTSQVATTDGGGASSQGNAGEDDDFEFIPGSEELGLHATELLIELVDARPGKSGVESLVSGLKTDLAGLKTDLLNKVTAASGGEGEETDGGGSNGTASDTMGHVIIPLLSLFEQPACDGWHLLEGCEGEIRIGWLLLPERPTTHSPPSPAAFLSRRAAAKARTVRPYIVGVDNAPIENACGYQSSMSSTGV